MINIFGLTYEKLCKKLSELGCKKFLASQIFDWIYKKNNYNLESYSNVKKENRELLSNEFNFDFIKIEKVEEDKDVKKFLFRLLDGQKIEAVLMYHDYGKSICVSSQVGCNMGCKFCESGRLKKVRNLETYEMVEQILLVSDYIKERIDSVVVMGIGEPFDNFDIVVDFIKIINDPKAFEIGARHITVSTCGIVPKIIEFAKLGIQANLAISLHAPSDEIRNKIMPISKAYPMNELIEGIKKYIDITHRRVAIEYIMLNGINDSEDDARLLCNLLKDINVYINLIPYNETNNIDYKASSKNKIDKFYNVLKEMGMDATIRRAFGEKISAACGQLRSKEM